VTMTNKQRAEARHLIAVRAQKSLVKNAAKVEALSEDGTVVFTSSQFEIGLGRCGDVAYRLQREQYGWDRLGLVTDAPLKDRQMEGWKQVSSRGKTTIQYTYHFTIDCKDIPSPLVPFCRYRVIDSEGTELYETNVNWRSFL